MSQPDQGAAFRAGSSARTAQPAVFVTLSAALVASQWMIAWLYAGVSAGQLLTMASVLPLILLLMLPMLGSVGFARHFADQPATPVVVLAVALTGLAMRLVYFGLPPLLEDDHYRYLLDGAMVAHGHNPYAISPQGLLERDVPPALTAIVEAGRNVISKVNFPDLHTMYPGGAQLIFAAAHLVAPWSLDGLRGVMMLFELSTFGLLLVLLPRIGRSSLWAALYWCNPLMAFTLTGQAHVDAAIPPLVLASLLLAHARHPASAGVVLGLAISIKFWPILLAPLMARMLGLTVKPVIIAAVAGGVTAAALCLPVVLSATAPDSGLSAYAGAWSINNMPFSWISWLVHMQFPANGETLLRLALAVIMGAIALAIAFRPVLDLDQAIGRALLIAAALFYLSPAQFPWYAAWFIPLAAARGNRPLLLASATLPVYYLFFPLAAAGERNLHGYGLAALHLLPVLIALIMEMRQRRQIAIC